MHMAFGMSTVTPGAGEADTTTAEVSIFFTVKACPEPDKTFLVSAIHCIIFC